jgi:hypothetical protein
VYRTPDRANRKTLVPNIQARRLVAGRTRVRRWDARPAPGKPCRCRYQLRETGDRQYVRPSARYYWLLLAESHLTLRLFASMVRRIEVLSVPKG